MSVEIVAELLEYAFFCLCISLEIVAVLEAFHGLPLFFCESLGYVYADVYNQVAFLIAVALDRHESLVAQPQSLSRLCSRLNLYLYGVAFYGRDVNGAAERSCVAALQPHPALRLKRGAFPSGPGDTP